MGGVKKKVIEIAENKGRSRTIKLEFEIEKFGDQLGIQSECIENKENSIWEWGTH